MLINTEYFSEAANHHEKHGYYNNALEGTREWENYWDEQKRRSLEGYSVGGRSITGYHYWYLNFSPILRIPKKSLMGESSIATKKEGFPQFYDWDYNYFWTIDIARHGISTQDYQDLELDIDIHPDDLSGGLHLNVLKARRKGYSFKNASMLSRNYHLKTDSKNYAFADDKEYLNKDGILDPKCWNYLDYINDNTPWGHPRIHDRGLHKYAGYRIKTPSGYSDRGAKNHIMGVSLKNDPEKSRGKDGDLILWEEAGKFPDLKKSWKIAMETVGQGKFVTGQMIAFGTGGEEGVNFESLEEMFREPEAYGCIRINNQWDDGASGTYCGFFVPAYCNFEGFMDEHGNSKKEEAKAFLEEKRETAKQASDPNALAQEISEQPFNPQEATTQADINIFPTAELQAHYNSVLAEKRWKVGVEGILYHDGKSGRIKFKPDSSKNQITKFPHGKKDDLEGCVVIYEGPIRNAQEQVPDNMYIGCNDPYDHDSSTDKESLGSTYIIKRPNRISDTMHECVVAEYVGRPSSQDEYNRIMFMLLEYYNAKLGFENDRGNVKEYAQRHKKLHLLQEQFEMLDKKELRSRNVNRPYGMHMTEARKNQGEIYIRDWLMTPVTTYEDSKNKLVLHKIYSPALLRELIKYHKDGNFDRVSSLMIGMYHMKELYNKQVYEQAQSPYEEFFLKKQHFT